MSTIVSVKELDIIERRCEAATKGPWERWEGHGDVMAGPCAINAPGQVRGHRFMVASTEASEPSDDPGCAIVDGETDEELAEAAEAEDIIRYRNADFIASARLDVPALIATVRMAREVLLECRHAAKSDKNLLARIDEALGAKST